MHIKDQQLTVEFGERTAGFVRVANSDRAVVTVSFTVVLLKEDMELPGGFRETVYLTPLPPSVVEDGGPQERQLPLGLAIPMTPGDINNAGWELHRARVFHLPRYPYPAEPFTATTFHGHIEVWPAMRRNDIEDTNEVVLPAKYPLPPSSSLTPVARIVRRLRYLFGR